MDQIALRAYDETSFKPDPKLSLEIVLVLVVVLVLDASGFLRQVRCGCQLIYF